MFINKIKKNAYFDPQHVHSWSTYYLERRKLFTGPYADLGKPDRENSCIREASIEFLFLFLKEFCL